FPAAVEHLPSLIDRAVVGYEPFGPVKLLVFPEHVHAAPVYFTAAQIEEHLALPVPNEHLDAYAEKARQHDAFILRSSTQTAVRLGGCLTGCEGTHAAR